MRKFRRILFAALALSSGAAAQTPDTAEAFQRGELGVRYWLSTGETQHAHNAQGVAPSLGNPTSVLLYENLDANVLELFGRQVFAQRWFLKGNLGVGNINTGSFDDEDFNRGQVKFSDTTSSVTEGWLAYGTLDVGHQWVLKQGAVNLGVFAGYSRWTEQVEASGLTDQLDPSDNIDNSVKVIANKLTWQALRIGFAGQFVFGRARIGVDLALIPYAQYREEDSHLLRQSPNDLGPAPNIIHSGDGRGVQFDAEVGYEVYRRTIVTLGWRYWYMEATNGTRSLPNRPDAAELPMTELYSKRTGLTASLRYLW
jgi:Omptin family